jgi:hypothetical protein
MKAIVQSDDFEGQYSSPDGMPGCYILPIPRGSVLENVALPEGYPDVELEVTFEYDGHQCSTGARYFYDSTRKCPE